MPSSFDDDLRAVEAHQRVTETLAHLDPKIARAQFRRDVKVARAKAVTVEARITKYIVTGAVVILSGISGCVAATDEPDNPGNNIGYQKYALCVEEGGRYDDAHEECDL